MGSLAYGEGYGGNAAENYQRYFVPAIGRPAALALVGAAAPKPGQRVLDVACGTGVVTRLAAEAVAPGGKVTGLDVNPAMIEAARAHTPLDLPVEWVEAPAEHMPLGDESFDLALCGMGVQFFEDRAAGLREIRRVLAAGGRLVLTLPGPIPPVFEVFEDGLRRHLGREAAGFASAVFSLHDPDEIRELLEDAGFGAIEIVATEQTLRLPPPEEFLWQYVHSTPLAGAVAGVDSERRGRLEREVCDGWTEHVEDGALVLTVNVTTARARRPA